MALTQTQLVSDAPDLKPVSAAPTSPNRLASIDILRAITMVLMIFVNDLWSLKNIPAWLEHVPRGVDGMGLADTIFPAFLFIVGMSLPLAIANRKAKGDSNFTLLGHIVTRTIGLLVMGLFLVNGEYINAAATGMPRVVWYSLSCISFILIWNIYPASIKTQTARILQGVGIAILLVLAFLYRGGEDDAANRFSIYWWGILGLIGWSYFTSALITLFAGKRQVIIVAAWVLFCGLSMVAAAKLIPEGSIIQLLPSPILGGTLVALSLGGALTTLLFKYLQKQNSPSKTTQAFIAISAGLILLGFYTRTFWGIAKLGATPPWLFICSALTILTFLVIYWIADVSGKARWFAFIKPAGTDTLLCYLMPYFAYAGVQLLNIHWPEFMLTGGVGLLKSFVFALLCVWVAGLLSKKGIRLKL
ncbi:heparan-alpha-glucosaminide N-acetyltransferase domain-containing protein [Adhaeribacter radiodurans]|uniref:DUF5009 domain-containing protein n=1 Tax=Adhaeribacter radiodurans TaxID=2745197 RepID=A0A7L7L2H5_9BACT|nr:DUF5009 domain-containing protein [Adhaeribacter radiodurans]QMU26963.1 DUF5009 domain-containing protein [Adhaeribacter radiodurans]